MIDFGTVRPGTTLYIPFATYDSNDPSASVTTTGLATTDIEIYKNGSTTQRSSDSGYTLLDTDGIDFDGTTGIHGFSIDLSDNTDSGFYVAGGQYTVVVASITVDAGTINFIAATFRIGYEGALFNTTIATLATQTSFTLTAGPAEDDALNGCVVWIHDIASAVQCGSAIVSDYTGSTKTVTLAAGTTFTAAAGDNIAIMPQYAPLRPTTAGRTLDADASGHVTLADGSLGDAKLAGALETVFETDFATNYNATRNAWATNVQDFVGTTASDPFNGQIVAASVTGAVGSVTGNVGGDVQGNVDGTVAGWTGITSLADWLGAIAGKTADTTTRTEINATTAGAGYNETTDSLEANRDNIGLNGSQLGCTVIGYSLAGGTALQSSIQAVHQLYGLDHLISSALPTNWATDVTTGSVFDLLAGGTFDTTTDSLEDIKDALGTAQTGDAYSYLTTNLGALGANATEAGGTGDQLTDITTPLGNISIGSSAVNTVAESYVLTTGTQSSGTVTSTQALDGTDHVHTDDTGAMELYYQFDVGNDGVPTSVKVDGNLTGINDSLGVYAYNWAGTSWDQIGTLAGVVSDVDESNVYDLLTSHVGTGSNVGKVRIRFYAASGLTTATLRIDRILATYTIASQGIANGSTITLSASTTNANLVGRNWNLALGGQDISGSYIFQSTMVSGTATGTNGTPYTFQQCNIGTASLAAYGFVHECAIADTLTLTSTGGVSADNINLLSCYSGVAGAGAPTINASGVTKTTNIQSRDWHGGCTGIMTSDCVWSHEVAHGGTQTFTNAGGQLELRGDPKAVALTTSGSATSNLVIGNNCPVSIAGTGGTVNLYGSIGNITNTATGVTVNVFSGDQLFAGTASGTPTTTVFDIAETVTADVYNETILMFTSGNAANQPRPILDHTTGQITVSEAFTTAPASGDNFVIYRDHIHPTTQIATAVLDADASSSTTNSTLGAIVNDWEDAGRLDAILDELTTQGDTNETKLDTLTTNVSTVDTVVDAILVDTGTTIPAQIGTPVNADISADIAAVKTDTGNLVTRITSTLFSGITSLAEWLGAMAGKQTADATAQTEIRATGAGSGTYDATTDSQEALQEGQGGSAPSAATIADAVWDEARSGHTTAGTFGFYVDAAISGVGGTAGSGADEVTINCKYSSGPLAGQNIADADVWISTDADGLAVVAGTRQTDSDGNVVFLLDDANTYYLWVQKNGLNEIQGRQFTAVAD